MWEPAAALLSGDLRVVTPDLPGHGDGQPVNEGVTLADLAEGVAAQIPRGAHLVGFSLGALVAQHLAVHRPELVASLTSVSSVWRRTPRERAAVMQRLHLAEQDFEGAVAASLHRWYDGTDVEPEHVTRTRATLLANDPANFLHCYRVFATADAEIAGQLGRISVPSLAITGENDPGSTPEMTRHLAAAIANCEFVVVPGARHMLPVQNPRALVDQVTILLERYAHV